ncbi:hypothetical protein GCM10023185_09190 [Hymenobacter saemangeumensis]|uniref:Uncharacterized protein n=1 Tax=Hymenobacter saemangeumensis TaxID=1084522 RepID=A0ABP8I4L3_9BACT
MEDYAAKMQLKTDAALREYVTGYQQYREDAVLAALAELRRRGQPDPQEPELRPLLEAGAARQRLAEAAEIERLRVEAEAKASQSDEADTPESAEAEDADSPSLYSPSSILIFSMLPISTMVAGGVLMCLNLYRVGRKRAVVGLALFILVYFFAGSALINWAVFQHGLNPVWAILLFNLPAALVYVLWVWPRYIGTTSFRSRSTLVPIIVCFVVMWGLNRLTPYLLQRQPKEVQQQLRQMMPPEEPAN